MQPASLTLSTGSLGISKKTREVHHGEDPEDDQRRHRLPEPVSQPPHRDPDSLRDLAVPTGAARLIVDLPCRLPPLLRLRRADFQPTHLDHSLWWRMELWILDVQREVGSCPSCL